MKLQLNNKIKCQNYIKNNMCVGIYKNNHIKIFTLTSLELLKLILKLISIFNYKILLINFRW